MGGSNIIYRHLSTTFHILKVAKHGSQLRGNHHMPYKPEHSTCMYTSEVYTRTPKIGKIIAQDPLIWPKRQLFYILLGFRCVYIHIYINISRYITLGSLLR